MVRGANDIRPCFVQGGRPCDVLSPGATRRLAVRERLSPGAASAARRTRSLRMVQANPTSGMQKLSDVLEVVPEEYRRICLSLPADTTIVQEGKRRTKIVSTVGPSTETEQDLLRLAAQGVNLIRLNMSHGSYAWHKSILAAVRKINVESPFVMGTMIDIGSLDMVRLGEISGGKMSLAENEKITLTTKHMAEYPVGTTEVSYDGFLDVASKGDLIAIDNKVEIIVEEVSDEDANCRVTVGGQVNSRAAIAIRGKSYQLLGAQADDSPCEVDSGCHPLLDIEFAIDQKVEYIALSFVESEEPINELKATLAERKISIGIVAKIESAAALEKLEEIVLAADAVMVARGDLGTAIPYQYVPVWQERIVKMCRNLGKPCLVSTHFLESMTVYPTPTRAEVTDITEAVNQGADALVLTSETASGKHPFKAVSVMNAVANKIEEQLDEKPRKELDLPSLFQSPTDEWATSATKIAENIASSASLLSSRVKPRAILVFTQKGLMASLLSRTRPQAPIFAFTPKPSVRSRLAILRGVRPFRVMFDDDPEVTIGNAIEILKVRDMVKSGDEVLVVADVLGGSHGAPEEEIRKVFDDLASLSGSDDGTMPRAMLRPALRQIGLKTSDAFETALGMSEADYTLSEVEGADTVAKRQEFDAQIDFKTFKEVVDDAVEIVHTIQLRSV